MDASDAGTLAIGDLSVPRLGYGTMRLPGPGICGPPRDRDEALRVLRRAVELGIRVLDTAWYYLRVLGLDQVPVTHLRWMDQPDLPFLEALGTLVALRDEGRIGRIGLSGVSLEQLEQLGLAYLPFFPLGMGKIGTDEPVVRVAQQLGVSPVRVALAWLLARSPVVLPIPGTSRVAHLEDDVAATSLRLPDNALADLSAGGRP